ncbi:hypothetical protein MVI01_01740 [Myxococcus virescens]|uniref:Uncharacterized protein n=1 Tax=Myxococcus virescens TaxID=83456 RepID=A0A511H4G0_9BACT|nr:hypothetical protein MVI01_01740 [Myxococcus virescens]
MPLGRREQRQRVQAQLRVGRDAREQRLEVPREALHGRAVEEVTVVLDEAAQAVRGLLEVQRHVELRRPRLQVQLLDGDAGQGQRLARHALEVERGLEQRRVGQVAGGLHCLHQLLERDVLVRIGAQRRLPHALEQLAEGRVAGQVRAQHQRVDEEADEALRLDPTAAVLRRADQDVRLVRVARQQGLERGQHRHEEGGVLTLAHLLERLHQRGRQVEGQGVPALRLDGGARTVRGELQHGRARELLLPVRHVRVERAFCRHPLALPLRVVRVLDGQLGQLRLSLGDERAVELRHLVDEDAQRRPVRDDVVHRQHQDVVGVRQPQQPRAQQRALHQVEGLANLLGGEPPCFRLAPVPRQ